jgi:signal transduction histidine kinase
VLRRVIGSAEPLLKYRWWFLGAVGAVIIVLELYEYQSQSPMHVHAMEVLLYWLLLVSLGILVELLIGNVDVKTRAIKLLELEQSFSFQLALANDWDDLIDLIVDNLISITEPQYLYLLTYNTLTNQYEFVADKGQEKSPPPAIHTQIPSLCLNCPHNDIQRQPTVELCRDCDVKEYCVPESLSLYCLPLNYGAFHVGFIYIMPPEGKLLTEEQIDILNKIQDDIAISLFTVRQRNELDEIRIKEVALTERRDLSRDLHDNLSQKLAVLRMKFDLLTSDDTSLDANEIKFHLEQMRSVADESYDIVRGTLVTLDSEAVPILSKLLIDQSKKVANRANIKIKVIDEGQPRPIPPNVQRQVFFVFREALSNVEKHAQATQADVRMVWGNDDLIIKISDNGQGFIPDSVDAANHFGLRYMKERTELVRGQFNLCSTPGGGTEISLHLPV